MKDKLIKLKEDFLEKLNKVVDDKSLRDLELQFLSRKGELSELMKEIKDVSADLRKEVGEFANKVKNELQENFDKVSKNFIKKESELSSDPTLPGLKYEQGHLNPITLIQNELEDLFSSLGFTIEDGPEIESDYFNFTALNVPPFHPARDMQDTFYVDLKNSQGERDVLMRT